MTEPLDKPPYAGLIRDAIAEDRELDDVTRARMRRRLLRGVAAGAAVATATTEAAAASKATASFSVSQALSGMSLLTKVGTAVSLSAVIGLGVTYRAVSAPSVEPAPAAAPPPAQVTTSPAPSNAPRKVAPKQEDGAWAAQPPVEPQPPPLAAPVVPPAPALPRRSSSVIAPGSPPSGRSLSDETASLREAQRRLKQGDAEGALEVLDRQSGGGMLEEERQAARVLALCQAGRLTEGRSAAQAFVARYGQSPHRARVLRACAADEALHFLSQPSLDADTHP
ncbi:MAG: hypothetical protein AAGA56_04940 [Myxococcota bacterium]